MTEEQPGKKKQGEVNKHQKDVNTAQTDVNVAQDEVNVAQGEVNVVQDEVNAVQKDVNLAQRDKNEIILELAIKLDKKIDFLTERVVFLEEEVGNFKRSISEASDALKQLKSSTIESMKDSGIVPSGGEVPDA